MDQVGAARAAAAQFIAALLAGDGQAIAAQMSAKAQGELLEAVRRWGVEAATAADAAARVWGGPWTVLLKDVTVDDVRIEGDRATVTYSHPTYGRDPDDYLPFRAIDGRWLVDEFVDDRGEDDVPPWVFPA